MTDFSQYQYIGTDAKIDYYAANPDILLVVPFEGCTDNENTSKASVVTQQTAGARTAYHDLPDPQYQVCYALVGGTAFGRAVGSIFLGYPSRAFRLKCLRHSNKPWLGAMRKLRKFERVNAFS